VGKEKGRDLSWLRDIISTGQFAVCPTLLPHRVRDNGTGVGVVAKGGIETPGDIILERWAEFSRNGGRHHPGMVGKSPKQSPG
jgi:hypothetical protein